MHEESHPLAGKKVRIKEGTLDPAQGMVVGGAEYEIEDWWDKLTGKSWMHSIGNFAAIHYAARSARNMLPIDNEVIYGHIDGLGHLVHVSEIDEELHGRTEAKS